MDDRCPFCGFTGEELRLNWYACPSCGYQWWAEPPDEGLYNEGEE